MTVKEGLRSSEMSSRRSSGSTPRKTRSLCPHCGQLLSLKTFKAHKRMYYDSSSNTWLSKQTLVAQDIEDMDAQDHHREEDEYPPESPPASFLPPPSLSPFNGSCRSQSTMEVDLSGGDNDDAENTGAAMNDSSKFKPFP